MGSEPVLARVRSINVSGTPRTVPYAGTWVTTGFFKSPTDKPVFAHNFGLDGDAQADLSVHGGPEKAVYFYPREHYAAWETLLGRGPLPAGSFGENITSEGLLESDLNIGDILQIGTASLQVLQPRSPCYKLQIRFERPDMTALFFKQAKPGWYASVVEEGTFSTIAPIFLSHRAPENVTVADVWQYSALLKADRTTLEHITGLELLPAFWKDRIGRHASLAGQY